MLTIGLYGVPDPQGRDVIHDHAVAVMREGRVLASIELERATGRKHDNHLDRHVDALIEPWLRSGESVRFVQANSFLGGSFASSTGSLELEAPSDVRLEACLAPSRIRLRGALAGLDAEAYTVSHELAHVGACLPFFGGFRPGTLLVHVDGGASVSACSVWIRDGSGLTCLHSSWDDLKDEVNNFNDNPLAATILGLDLRDHLSIPGKLMGLASYGTPRPDMLDWLRENRFFLDRRRSPTEILGDASRLFGLPLAKDLTGTRLGQDLAACMQHQFESSLLEFLRTWKSRTGARRLAYAGGAALNVLANTRIERELGFDRIGIPPAPSDCGLALGAAAIAEWLGGHEIPVHSPYLTRLRPGESGGVGAPSPSPAEVAERLATGGVVASILGAAEVGPRALGHRSLLAQPASISLRHRVSEEMKGREWYRPVAPVLLPEVARECLDGFDERSPLADFMLGAWTVKTEWRGALAGAVHVDGTARAQVVRPDAPGQAALAEVLRVLLDDHGVCGLINTSLNQVGAPMLQDSASARRQAVALGVDAVWSAPEPAE